MASEVRIRGTARAIALVAPVSLVCLVAFFALGGWFGKANDLANALLGVLCGLLAVQVGRPLVALIGAVGAVLGTALVLSDTTGYYLAGLVSACGFALVGVWLLATPGLPARRLAVVAGGWMAIGLVAGIGIVQGQDDQDTAPWWLLASGLAWGGTYLALPWWASRVVTRARSTTTG